MNAENIGCSENTTSTNLACLHSCACSECIGNLNQCVDMPAHGICCRSYFAGESFYKLRCRYKIRCIQHNLDWVSCICLQLMPHADIEFFAQQPRKTFAAHGSRWGWFMLGMIQSTKCIMWGKETTCRRIYENCTACARSESMSFSNALNVVFLFNFVIMMMYCFCWYIGFWFVSACFGRMRAWVCGKFLALLSVHVWIAHSSVPVSPDSTQYSSKLSRQFPTLLVWTNAAYITHCLVDFSGSVCAYFINGTAINELNNLKNDWGDGMMASVNHLLSAFSG